jgi:hypothetical protein
MLCVVRPEIGGSIYSRSCCRRKLLENMSMLSYQYDNSYPPFPAFSKLEFMLTDDDLAGREPRDSVGSRS